MVRENRVVASLLLKHVSPSEWRQAIETENQLQKRSPATAKRFAMAIRKRLELLEPEFWRAIVDGDDELATQVALCAALERNLLLVEFMERVMADAYATHAEKLERYYWQDFIAESALRDPALEDWKESTKKKMGQVVMRMLAETGYIATTRSLKLQHVSVRPELRAMLEDTYRHRIKKCMEVSYKGGR